MPKKLSRASEAFSRPLNLFSTGIGLAPLMQDQVGEDRNQAQKRVISAGVAASPFDPEAWLAERLRRQRDTLQTLRRLVAEKADRDQRLAALRTLVVRLNTAPTSNA